MADTALPMPEGTILPPPEIRAIVEKTAAHIAKKDDGAALEAKIRLRGASDPRFSFLRPDDAYYPFYQWRLELVRTGAAEADTTGGGMEAIERPLAAMPDDGRPKVPEPASYEFLAEMPPINTVDLDILRLTALFAARTGPRFSQELAEREKNNYQFDFLRPEHSLFRYYNRIVAQYTVVMQADTELVDRLAQRGGGTNYLTEGERTAKGKREVMQEVQQRAEWERWEREKRQKEQDDAEAERVAFAEVDWQDFVVVSTIEFTDQDDLMDLPAPITLSDIVNRSLKQKRMAAMIMEGKDVVDDDDEDARVEIAAAAAVTAANPGTLDAADEAMEVSDDEEPAAAAPAEPARPAAPTGAIKIRKDHVPKSKREKKVATSQCTICGQQIPETEMSEHVRIELLDPRWKEKQRQMEANRSAGNLIPQGADVAASLRNLAKRRTDIFGSNATEEEKRLAAAEEARLTRERESKAWDGHIASSEAITDRYQSGANLDQQIAALHKAKGLVNDGSAADSGIGPAVPASGAPVMAPPPVDATTYAGASITAAPNPSLQQPSAYGSGSYGGYPGMPAPPPGTFPSSGPTGPPGSTAMAPNVPGIMRPADGQPEDEPPAKRAKMPMMSSGTFYPEKDWLEAHLDPITLIIRCPVNSERPEWKLTGQDVRLDDLPLTTLVSALRDHITKATGVPTARQQFKHNDRPLTLSNSLAALNFDNGDVLSLEIKAARKR